RRLTTKVRVREVHGPTSASAWTRATARDSSPPSSGWTSRSTRSTSTAHCRRTNAATCAGSNSPKTVPPTSLSHITSHPYRAGTHYGAADARREDFFSAGLQAYAGAVWYAGAPDRGGRARPPGQLRAHAVHGNGGSVIGLSNSVATQSIMTMSSGLPATRCA